MKFSAILLALVACAVAAPVIETPSTIRQADQLMTKEAKVIERHANNAKKILENIQKLEEGPRTYATLQAINKARKQIDLEYESAEQADKRALDAFTAKQEIARQKGENVPVPDDDPYRQRAYKAYQEANDARANADSIESTLESFIHERQARREEQEQDRKRFKQFVWSPILNMLGIKRDPLENRPLLANEPYEHPAEPKSIMTIMKENPGRTAAGAAFSLAALASIYALIARRKRLAMNATLTANSTANSTAVPSIISAPINTTAL